jgi:hypothetical protein
LRLEIWCTLAPVIALSKYWTSYFWALKNYAKKSGYFRWW